MTRVHASGMVGVEEKSSLLGRNLAVLDQISASCMFLSVLQPSAAPVFVTTGEATRSPTVALHLNKKRFYLTGSK